MKIWFVAICVSLLPCAAFGATPDASGNGAHGYDWLIGTWTCKNAAAATIGGPATQTVTFRKAAGGIGVSVTGSGFERSGYVAYDAAHATWWRPFSYPNGNHYVESTTQTGKKTVWTGPYTDVASGATFMVRDTFTVESPTQYTDVGEFQSGNAWKVGYDGVCTKS